MAINGKRKLLLINPANYARGGYIINPANCFMPLGLGIVAALTPDNWEVELFDESFEKFTFKQADLVAFTSFTSSAFRAYEISKIYKDAGIHTVMGGIHASMCPEEASNYVDTVVTGEAEGAWPALINDFESGSIKRLYDGGIVDIHSVPHVRREIYKYPYVYDLVQTTRGCPWGCDFCSVTQMCGKTYRERDIEDVLDELEKTNRPALFFVDDNLVNNKKGADERAIRLFKGMIQRGLKKFWFSQAALNFADNEEVLYWAKKSGCVMILMGFEAENIQALKDVGKTLNLKKSVGSYDSILKKIHKHGISVLATMIFGMDNDTQVDLKARGEFIKNSSIDSYQCTILTPLPGTSLYTRMKDQNRIILNDYPSDWQHYHFMVATSKNLQMNPEELFTNTRKVWVELYDKQIMRRKMFRTLWNTRSFQAAYFSYATNHNYGRMCLEGGEQSSLSKGIIPGSSWKNYKRTMYLKSTDVVVWLMYKLVWTKMINRIF